MKAINWAALILTGATERRTMGRSRATKPTRNQKEIMLKAGYVVKNWLVLEDTEKELHLVSRGTGVHRRIKKDRLQTV